MATSPFKFLDSYTKDDKDIFFGRERELEELYHRVFEGKIMLVYGVSGTGKSSLIHCGLANKFNEADWLPVNIRRAGDMVQSMAFAIGQAALTPMEGEIATPAQFKKAVRSLYLDHYKPVFFIFDQFEELFIFGNKEEKKSFVQIVKALTESDLQCRFMFVLREEYLAGITEFEKVIPTILANRVRIEKMTLANAKQVIEGPCKVFGIEVEDGFSDEMLEKLSPGSAEVELTYLQVYLDKVYRTAQSTPVTAREERAKQPERSGARRSQSVDEKIASQSTLAMTFTKDILKKLGEVKDLLGSFLDEQIDLLPNPDSALAVLKSFVSVKGTKRQMSIEEVQDYAQTLGKPIGESAMQELLQTLIQLRILRDKDQNNRYELRHDALASKIYEKITLVEKELLEIRHLIENAYSSWEKRGVLLSADDLAYIAPYENKLYLSKELEELIEKSKYALVKAKRRRRTIAFASLIALLLVFAGFTWWAMGERKKAILQQHIALEAKSRAEKSEQEAINAKEIAVQELYFGIKPSLSVEISKMNILYAGVINNLRISASGINEDNFIFKIIEGGNKTKLTKTGPFTYSIIPERSHALSIKIFGVTNKNDTIDFGTKNFRVMSVPDPYSTVIGLPSRGVVSSNDIINAKGIEALMPQGFDFDISFKVTSFTIHVTRNGYLRSLSSKNQFFTKEQKRLIEMLKSEETLIIADITVIGTDGSTRILNDLVYQIK